MSGAPAPAAWTAEASAQPLRVSRLLEVVQIWDGEVERVAPQQIHVYEPIRTNAPANARPYCWGMDMVDFLDPETDERIDRVETHRLNSPSIMLFATLGEFWERASGRVLWRRERWMVRHAAYRNTRWATVLRLGREAEARQ